MMHLKDEYSDSYYLTRNLSDKNRMISFEQEKVFIWV